MSPRFFPCTMHLMHHLIMDPYPKSAASSALHVVFQCKALQGGECCHLGHPAVLRSIVISTKVKILPPRIFSMHTLICRARPNESSVTSTFQKAHLRPQQQGDIESREARQRRSCPPPTVVRFSLLPLKRSEWKADPLYISQVGSLSSTCLPLLVFKVAFLCHARKTASWHGKLNPWPD